MAPAGTSGYDLYQSQRAGGIGSLTQHRLKERLLPKLLQAGDELLKKRYEAVNFQRDEMDQFVRMYGWAADLDPADQTLAAKRAYAIGLRALQRNALRDAMSAFRDAIQKDPKWALPLNDLGRAYVRAGDNANAEQFYRQALQADPKWVFPQLNLAGVYLHFNRFAEAEAEYRRAADMDPTLATPTLGRCIGRRTEQRKRSRPTSGPRS